MLAATSSPPVTMDCLDFLVSDCLIPTVNMVPACKLDSSSVVSVTDCLSSTPPSTSACEMNIRSISSGIHAPNVVVQQVMNSDAALNSVIISKTKNTKSHFHITCLLKGHHHTVAVMTPHYN